MRFDLSPVRPELVEGLPFFIGRKIQGFDKLSPNGSYFAHGAMLVHTCAMPVSTPPADTQLASAMRRLARRKLMKEISAIASAKATPGPTAARSQDFLYGNGRED
ncbi:MAG: hypothetical protein JO221_00380 [Sphingomonas sp.]|nr:hypothetical protein [Sphingomonas sp.]